VESLDLTGQYNTTLTPEELAAYKAWLAQLSAFKGRDVSGDTFDYDLAGAFKAGETPDARGHLDDRFKKPNHMTFSQESIYSGSDPMTAGGQWLPHRPGRWDFQASPANLRSHGRAALEDYFRRVEPNSHLYMPDWRSLAVMQGR